MVRQTGRPEMDMQPLTQAQFQALIKGAEVLESQEDKPSALLACDGNIIKIWQRRSGLSSDRLKPYSQRFRSNCEELNRRGIRAPVVTSAFEVKDSGEHVLLYPEIPGKALISLARENDLPLRDLAGFYAELHGKGVHFRSIHLGNVLRLEPDGFALIDVTDTTFTRKPLSLRKRAENLGYAWAYRSDHAYFDAEVRARLLAYYETAAGLPQAEAGRFRKLLDQAYDHYTVRRRRQAAA